VADIQLEEIVWLSAVFDAYPQDKQKETQAEEVAAPPSESTEAVETEEPPALFSYRGRVDLTAVDGVELSVTVEVTDPDAQFAFTGKLGARFRFSDAATYHESAVRSTLMWMVFPYAREMVATITARSPHGAYYLPPMTLMPDPAAVAGAPAPHPAASDEG
jgi:hypothetical protein